MRRALIIVGTLTCGYALAGAVTDPDVRLIGVLVFLAAVLILHDGVLLPLTIGAGVLLGHLPPAARTPVRIATLISLAVTVVGAPLLPERAWGLLLTLAVVWVPAGLVVLCRKRITRNPSSAEGPPGT